MYHVQLRRDRDCHGGPGVLMRKQNRSGWLLWNTITKGWPTYNCIENAIVHLEINPPIESTGRVDHLQLPTPRIVNESQLIKPERIYLHLCVAGFMMRYQAQNTLHAWNGLIKPAKLCYMKLLCAFGRVGYRRWLYLIELMVVEKGFIFPFELFVRSNQVGHAADDLVPNRK